jgi:hypothetical protein
MGYFVWVKWHRHTLDLALEDPRFLCRLSLNVVVDEERALDGPEDLTTETIAHIGLYTHRAQADRGLVIDLGCRIPDTPTPVDSFRRNLLP